MILVLLAAGALVLNAQGKLIPIGSVLFNPQGYGGATTEGVGYFALAFFVYLLLVSFLDDTEAEYLTGVLVLGALVYNAKTEGQNAVLPALFNVPAGSAGESPFNPFGGGGNVVPDPNFYKQFIP